MPPLPKKLYLPGEGPSERRERGGGLGVDKFWMDSLIINDAANKHTYEQTPNDQMLTTYIHSHHQGRNDANDF